ncbi:HAP5 [Candida jiufengensis]|uniref:HAP5 n=1 Tax=Candida jiufengensis TaxID=497108 RepID=UPI0022254C42|nr:HAP5 [Candida jiufengensis]KAI5956227.1 HAP5 [Candida jiufengensis]
MDGYEESQYIDNGHISQYEDQQSHQNLHQDQNIIDGTLQHQHSQEEYEDIQNQQESQQTQPQYDEEEQYIPNHQNIVDESELLAAQAAAEAAAAAQQQQPGDVFNNVAQGLEGKHRDTMMQYWQETINSIEHDEHDFKNHQLPLARIKKVMKTDEDVRMISAEAPILFAKGCDIFITELTMRAWIHAEENKRRTLQKSDIAAALTKSDMFDFLIDVVPREEEKPNKKNNHNNHSNNSNNPASNNYGVQQ